MRSPIGGSARAARDEDGITLVEVMVAIFVLVLVSVGAASFLVKGVRTTNEQAQKQSATSLAIQGLEAVQAVPISRLLVGRSQAAVNSLNTDPVMVPLVAQDVLDADNYDPGATASSAPVIPLQQTQTLKGSAFTVRTAINRCWLSETNYTCTRTRPAADAISVIRATVSLTWGSSSCSSRCRYAASSLLDRQGDPIFNLATSTPIISTATGPDGTSKFTVGTTTLLTLQGTSFRNNAKLTLSGGDGTIQLVSVSSDGKTATANLTAGAVVGSYTLVWVNPDTGRAEYSPIVIAPAPPTITAVSPATAVAGSSGGMTITGTNFIAGATLTLSGGNGSFSASTVASGGGSISTTWSAGSAAGTYVLTVRNPDGGLATSSVTVTPLPTISSVTPNSLISGRLSSVTIRGTNFVSGATLTAATGAGTFSSIVVAGDGQSLTSNWTAGTAPGDYRLTLTNPDSGSATATITVAAPPPPTISSVTPNLVNVGATTSLTLTGTNFQTGATATLSAGGSTGNVVTTSSTSMSLNLTAAATPGVYTLTVRNPDNQTATTNVSIRPVAGSECGATNAFGATTWDVRANDRPNTGTIAITRAPSAGTATVSNSMIRFDPPDTAARTYTMEYTTTVNGVTSAPAVFTVKIRNGSC